MLTLPQRSHLIAAFCVAAFFAIPMVTLISCMVIFPIFIYGALAIYVIVGLLALPFAIVLQQMGLLRINSERWHNWMLAAIVWTGCAIGFANWGAVGSQIGAKNQPFLEVFFAPVVMLLRHLMG